MEAVKLENNAGQLSVDEAKEKFRHAMSEIDPMRAVERSPIHSVGLALLAGVAVGTAGRKIPGFFAPGMLALRAVLKQLI